MIELLIVVAIISITGAVAVPTISSSILSNRIKTAVRSLETGILLARDEAITRNQTTRIVQSEKNNYLICVIELPDDSCDKADSNRYINSFTINSDHISIHTDKSASDGIDFNNRGRLAEASRSASIAVCDSRGNPYGVMLEINQVGRTNTAPISEDADISCSNAS